jgi:hypothetical protein
MFRQTSGRQEHYHKTVLHALFESVWLLSTTLPFQQSGDAEAEQVHLGINEDRTDTPDCLSQYLSEATKPKNNW